jgi:Ca2+-binding RTX toxin-like protein
MLLGPGGSDELDGGPGVDAIDGGTGNVTARDVAPDLDPLVTAVIATPGTVQVNGPAQFSGQLFAGRLALTGGVTVHSKFEPAQL